MNFGPEDEDDLVHAQDHQGSEDDDAGDASLDSDAGDGDEGSGADGEDGDDHSPEDALGGDEGKAGQGSAQVEGARKGNPEFGRLRARAREAEERAKRLEDALLSRQEPTRTGPDPAVERQRARAAELETARETARLNGDPASVVAVTEKHLREDFQSEIQSLRFATAESADRSAFESLCARNPAVAGLREDVEARLAQERRSGINYPRATVAKFLLGERALKNAGRARTVQGKKAAEGVRREASRPANGRSDLPRGGAKTNDSAARRKRLEDMNI